MGMRPSVLLDGGVLGLQRVGGVRRVFEQLLLALAAETEPGLTVHVPFKTPFESLVPRRVHWVRDWDFRPWRLARKTNAFRVRQACRRGRVNVFHSIWFEAPPCSGLRTVVTVYDMAHELHPALRHDEETRRIKKRAIDRADLCLAISEQTKHDVVQVYGISEAKVRVIPLGVTQAFRAPASPDRVAAFKTAHGLDGPYWVHVGCRGGYKNFDKTVEGFVRIAGETNGYLVVVGGEDALGGAAESVLAAAGCRQRVIRLDYVQDADLNAIYSGSAGLISTSLAEGFGLPLLEAAGSGSVAIVSDIPVYREVLEGAALFVDPGDPEAIAAGLKASIRNDLRNRLVVAGRAKAAGCSWQRSAQEHVRAYRDVSA